MMQFIKDIVAFLNTLSLIDYILYFSVLTLIILVISLIFLLKNKEEDELAKKPIQSECDDEIDLTNIVNTIDEKPKPIVDLTEYENEQEEKAIISYEELLKTAPIPIHYEEEQYIDNEVQVKKIDLEKTATHSNNETLKQITNPYIHEEEFLKTLKQLNELLN